MEGSGGGEGLPTWATVAGWVLAFIAVIQIPIWGTFVICRNHNKTLKKVRFF